MRITRQMLRAAKPENVRRLARFLKLRNTDDMSHRQLCSLVNWLLRRGEKKSRGTTFGGWTW